MDWDFYEPPSFDYNLWDDDNPHGGPEAGRPGGPHPDNTPPHRLPEVDAIPPLDEDWDCVNNGVGWTFCGNGAGDTLIKPSKFAAA